jgi:hypothetical protein
MVSGHSIVETAISNPVWRMDTFPCCSLLFVVTKKMLYVRGERMFSVKILKVFLKKTVMWKEEQVADIFSTFVAYLQDTL